MLASAAKQLVCRYESPPPPPDALLPPPAEVVEALTPPPAPTAPGCAEGPADASTTRNSRMMASEPSETLPSGRSRNQPAVAPGGSVMRRCALTHHAESCVKSSSVISSR
jgi:hypothetical protein